MRESEASSTGTTSRRPCCRADPNKPAPSAGSRHTRSRPSSSKPFEITSMNPTEIADALLIQNHVARVEVQSDQLVIELTDAIGVGSKRKRKSRNVIEVPWRKTPSTRRREILVPESEAPQNVRPIRSENRALLVASIARGRRWLDELIDRPDCEYRKHRRARGMQRAEGQHDDLARLPRARPRQGSHRWAASARNGSCPAERYAGRMVSSAPDAWLQHVIAAHSNRVSA